jgi:glycosyltransferase involved in cell wall biosynthesis
MTQDVSAPSSRQVVVICPVYEDWPAVRLLLPRIGEALASVASCARVLLVNDGSATSVPNDLVTAPLATIEEVRVLSLRRNVGHQRALAIGLAYAEANMPCDAVVVMDADGEDDPADVPRLLETMCATRPPSVVFAQRTRRSEGLVFTSLYRLYRSLHHLLTGIPVQVGNFSVIPRVVLARLAVVSDLWNHYAAAVFQSRIPYTMVPTARARRLSGQSRMNFVSLVAHGLSAIAVFADRVGVRILIAALAVLAASLAVLGGVFLRLLLTGHSSPGWLIAGVVVALVLTIQTAATAGLFVLQVLFARASSTFIPTRDYPFFVHSDESAWKRQPEPL